MALLCMTNGETIMSIKYILSLFVAALIGFAISPSYSQEVIFCDGFECPAGNDPALEARIAALEALLADVSRGTDPNTGQDTLTFGGVNGMNVQVVNGKGTTSGQGNGTGNLIIGYNELRGSEDVRTGSHTLVIGKEHNYSSRVGMVVGFHSTVSGDFASVSGGANNTASGPYASVSGGLGNTASGERSSVSGGQGNVASGLLASVSGGGNNEASGARSSVSGGYSNIASFDSASVSGGFQNLASGERSSVSGGQENTAENDNASVSGGQSNTASGEFSSVSGGDDNTASGNWASVSGGSAKLADVDFCTTAGEIGTDCTP